MKQDDVAQIRIARPTDRLEAVVRFYREGLGFAVVAEFHDHAGYDGVVMSLPGRNDQLEFTSHVDGSPCPSPTRDNLLVLFMSDDRQVVRTQRRLEALGCRAVTAENPYWTARNAITYEDPDGWRVVLVHGSAFT